MGIYLDNMLSKTSFKKINFVKVNPRSQVSVAAGSSFIGSPVNQTITLSTALFLTAGRFGVLPSANKPATAGLKLKTRDSGLKTNDPAGFTAVDTLAYGAIGHIVGVGIYLGTAGSGSP